MARAYQIDDEGDYIEVHLIQDGEKVGGLLVDVEPLGIDAAWGTALLLGLAFQKAHGAEPQAAYP